MLYAEGFNNKNEGNRRLYHTVVVFECDVVYYSGLFTLTLYGPQ